jgi:hypothetical protein
VGTGVIVRAHALNTFNYVASMTHRAELAAVGGRRVQLRSATEAAT